MADFKPLVIKNGKTTVMGNADKLLVGALPTGTTPTTVATGDIVRRQAPFISAGNALLLEPVSTESFTGTVVTPNTVPSLVAVSAWDYGTAAPSTRYTWGGGVPEQQGTGSSIVARSCVSIPRSIRAEFFCDSPLFEIVHVATGSNQTRVLLSNAVGTQWRELFYTADATGVEKSIKMDFSGSRRVRRFRVESSNLGFGGVRINATDSLFAAPITPRPVCVWVGDSITLGVAGRTTDEGYAVRAGGLLGWEVHVDAISGCGYLNPGLTVKFRDRISNVTISAPQYVVVSGGINDRTGYTVANVVTEAQTYWAQIKAALPNAVLIVMSPFKTHTTINVAALNTALATAATAAGYSYIDTTTWITGTGRSGATTGDGNADIMCSTDSLHPTAAGHEYLGIRTAQAIRTIFSS